VSDFDFADMSPMQSDAMQSDVPVGRTWMVRVDDEDGGFHETGSGYETHTPAVPGTTQGLY